MLSRATPPILRSHLLSTATSDSCTRCVCPQQPATRYHTWLRRCGRERRTRTRSDLCRGELGPTEHARLGPYCGSTACHLAACRMECGRRTTCASWACKQAPQPSTASTLLPPLSSLGASTRRSWESEPPLRVTNRTLLPKGLPLPSILQVQGSLQSALDHLARQPTPKAKATRKGPPRKQAHPLRPPVLSFTARSATPSSAFLATLGCDEQQTQAELCPATNPTSKIPGALDPSPTYPNPTFIAPEASKTRGRPFLPSTGREACNRLARSCGAASKISRPNPPRPASHHSLRSSAP